MEAEDNLHFAAAPAIDKNGAENASFETLTPGLPGKEAGADTWQRLLPSDEAMTILHAPESADRRAPGFGYWLLVALVAVSVFWTTGGHTLFTRVSPQTSPVVDPMLTTGSIAHKNDLPR